MVSKANPATNPGRVRITLATLTVLAMTAAILLLVSTTAQAESGSGAVPNLQVSSASPGTLTIAWDAPDPAPSDYRVIWAKQDLDFLSYKNSNEANRGNEYPSGEKRSITLTGLSKGETFKVMARARYTSGGNNDGPWSGPWTDTVSARVQDDPPAAPTGLTAGQVTHDSVNLTWTAPSSGSTVTGYRVLRGADANSLSAITRETGSTGTEYRDFTVAAETTYHYAVLALSQDGDGAQSAALSVTTPAEPSEKSDDPKATAVPNRLTRAAPGVPRNLAVVPADAQLTFTWDPPTNTGGSPIIRYNYAFGPSGGTQADGNHGTNPTGSQSLTKTGLTNGTAYTFKVRAVTNFGSTTTVGPHTAVVTGTPNGPITLVSNASEASTGSGSTHFLAQSFGTGSHSTGYTVSEVQIYLAAVSGKSTNVRIREDNSGAPGDEVALLMNSGTFTANEFNTFTAPADTVLRGSRTYWLSVNDGISSASRMSYGSTSGTGQTGATGWTIADGRRYRSSESASWTTDSVSLRITVKGTANPPDTTAPSFESAAANGTSLVITFDEDLAAAASLVNSAFTVKKTPSGGTEEEDESEKNPPI